MKQFHSDIDDRLLRRLDIIEKYLATLTDAEETYLELEANRKITWAQLYLKTAGKNVAEREAMVYASDDWRDFMAGHVSAESKFNHAKREYELRLKAYDACHLSVKNELPAIKRQVV